MPGLHLICNAHLDPVWQWRWEEGCAEALSTFRQAALLLNEHPGLLFNHNEALLYRWVEKHDPVLFREIRRLVKIGRWCIAGGWYLQPDANLPGTESLIRQIALGRRYFGEHFGVYPRVAYNFDSFGHSGGLPQILIRSGYRMYIHMRPHAELLPLPSDLYRWQGVDGSEILAYRIAVGLYHTEYDNIEERIDQGTELALKLGRDVPVFWGIGDHGGGATREDLRRIDQKILGERRVRIMHSTPELYYRAVRENTQTAPVVTGGLQRIFTGCYTSIFTLKQASIESLGLLHQTETANTLAWRRSGEAEGWRRSDKELEKAWRAHIFNDFHDILPGSCTEPAASDALALYGYAAGLLRPLRLSSMNELGSGSPSGEIPITVFSSLTGLDRFPVEVECMISHRPKWSGLWHLRLTGPDGREIPCQEEQPEALLPFNGWRRKVVFMADMWGAGSRRYGMEPVAGKKTGPTMKKRPFRVNTASGLIETLSVRGRKILSGPLMKAIVVEDKGDSWGSGFASYRKMKGVFELISGSAMTLARGTVRTVFESQHRWRQSRISMQTCVYAEWPVLEYRLRIHWNEEKARLKLAIPTVFRPARILCEVPGGAEERPADGEEHVHGRWILLHPGKKDDAPSLGIAHTGAHGFDCMDGELRLSVLRSAAYCHEQGMKLEAFPYRKFMDQGVHEIRLLVSAGPYSENMERLPALADLLSSPPYALAHLPFAQEGPEGGAPLSSLRDASQREEHEKTASFPVSPTSAELTLEPDHVRLLACKRSWDGKAMVCRVQEKSGMRATCCLRVLKPECTARFDLSPFEIKTVRIEKTGWREVDMIDET